MSQSEGQARHKYWVHSVKGTDTRCGIHRTRVLCASPGRLGLGERRSPMLSVKGALVSGLRAPHVHAALPAAMQQHKDDGDQRHYGQASEDDTQQYGVVPPWLTLRSRRRPFAISPAGGTLWPCQAVATVAAESDDRSFQVPQAFLVPIHRWG